MKSYFVGDTAMFDAVLKRDLERKKNGEAFLLFAIWPPTNKSSKMLQICNA